VHPEAVDCVTGSNASAICLAASVSETPANCCVLKRPNREALEQLQETDFVVDGGRALIIPIWFGSYQRFLPGATDAQQRADRERESALAWHRDIRIVLDYLETRPAWTTYSRTTPRSRRC
jgi:hypothetical protein